MWFQRFGLRKSEPTKRYSNFNNFAKLKRLRNFSVIYLKVSNIEENNKLQVLDFRHPLKSWFSHKRFSHGARRHFHHAIYWHDLHERQSLIKSDGKVYAMMRDAEAGEIENCKTSLARWFASCLEMIQSWAYSWTSFASQTVGQSTNELRHAVIFTFTVAFVRQKKVKLLNDLQKLCYRWWIKLSTMTEMGQRGRKSND